MSSIFKIADSTNTLTEIKYALFSGVDMLKLDLQRSKSGDVFLFPGEIIDDYILIRRGDSVPSSNLFSELSSDEINKLRTKEGYRIPLLKDAIDTIYSKAKIALVIPDSKILNSTLAVIKEYISFKTPNCPQFILSSRDIALFQEKSELYQSINISKAVIWETRDQIPFNYELLLFRYSIKKIFLSPEILFSDKVDDFIFFPGFFLVKYFQNLKYHVYTTSLEEDQIPKVIDLKVDGITLSNLQKFNLEN